MANSPKDPKGSNPNIRDSGVPPEPSNPELPEWLRTDEWLKLTPPPHEDPQQGSRLPASEQTDQFRHDQPENPEQGTELIEIIDEQDSSPTTPRHDHEDSLFLTDDVQVISAPPSGILPSYPEGDIPGPRSGKNPKQIPVNDEDVDLSALFGETPSSGTPSSVLRRSGLSNDMATPPASGWFSKPMLPSPSTSSAPTEALEEEASDIFTTDRPARSSDTQSPNTGAGSALYTGAASNIFVEDRDENRTAGGESNLLADPKTNDRGSSVNDDASKLTDRVNFELPNLPRGAQPSHIGSSAGDLIVIPDEDVAASGKTMPAELEGIEFVDGNLSAHSGSNLFGEQAADFNLPDKSTEESAVNLSNPEINPSVAGPLSSIFDIPNPNPAEQPSGEGRVNIDHIPAFGSSDEKTEAMLNLDLDGGPSSSVFSGESRSGVPDDSGLIEWANPDTSDESTYLAEYQRSSQFESDASSVELPGLDDSIELGDANTGAGSASIFGPTSGRGRSLPKLPGMGSDPEFVVNKTVLASAVAAAAGAAALQAKTASGSNASAGMPQPVMPAAPQPRGGKILAGILGTMAGLALGVGGMSVLRDTGSSTPQPLAGNTANPPAATVSGGTTPAATTAPGDAKSLLASGNVQAALAAYEKAGDNNEAKAGRGQARWMLRVRTAANSKQPLQDGDAELKKAADDLKAVFDATSSSSTPEDQLIGARAALNLGLIREVAGKPAEALNIYQDAKRKYGGQFIKWFDAAILRITVMRKNADGTPSANFSQAAPALQLEDADRIASLSVILMNFDPVQELEDEAGFHFWKAINRSASWDQGKKAFDEAIRFLDDAKRAHDLQRKKLVGMGLNPISDPREQMFLRACDELKFYWQFKGQIYGDPTGMAIARGGNGVAGKGTGGILTDLLTAKKSYDGVAAKVASADKALMEAKAAGEALVAANKKLEELAAEKKQASDTAAKAEADLKAATELATKAKAELADAQGKLKVADTAVDAVIVRMKSAKLLDEKATRTEALAALPDLTKKMAIVATGSNETTELTRQLNEAQSQLKMAQTKLKDAEVAAQSSKADVEKKVKEATASLMAKTTDLENKVKLADENAKAEAKKAADAARAEMEVKLVEMKKAIQQVQTESAEKLDRANQQLATAKTAIEDEKRLNEAKLTAQAEQYRSQLAAVKSGATVQLIEADRVALDRASKGYQDGVEAYFSGQYFEGISSLSAASKDDPTDARIWYYLGLCRWNTGDQEGAKADFRRGATLEARGKPNSTDVGVSLQRIQGPIRQTLDQFRP